MKKAALFTTQFSKSNGGIQNLSYYTFEELRKHFDCIGYSSNINDDEKLTSVYYSPFTNISFFMRLTILFKSLFDFIKFKQNINISFHWRLSYAPFILKKLFSVPYIVYVYGNDIYYHDKSFFKRYLIKKILTNASKVIAISKYTEKLCKHYNNKNICIIHPGIKYKNIQISAPGPERIILTLGRLEKRKGIDTTLRAIPEIITKIPNIKFLIAGTGPYKNNLQDLVNKLNLGSNVEFLGFVSEQEKEKLFQKCDLFLMPSYEIEDSGSVEGFGIVYLEANMYGKWVIGGNSGGVPDAVLHDKTGYLVNGQNPAEIANAIHKFYDEKFQKKDYTNDVLSWAAEHDYSKLINPLLIELEYLI